MLERLWSPIWEHNHMLLHNKRQIRSNKQKANKKINTLNSLKNWYG